MARLAHGAGRIILDVQARGMQVRQKADTSPVTQADEQAEAFIEAGLNDAFPGVPVIGEELVAAGRAPLPGQRFFLVDPLDGTKEFVAGRDSFSTNIALAEDGKVVAGVICAPAQGAMFVGGAAWGLWHASGMDMHGVFDAGWLQPFQVENDAPRRAQTAVLSFSHMDEATQAWLDERGMKVADRTGSAWKFCRLLQGAADVYPRLGNTWEWDTAAGQALLEAAGGQVLLPDESGPLSYGHHERNFLNPGFIACAPGVRLNEEA